MADINTSQQFQPVLMVTNAAGQPATVQPGSVVWASSDPTVISVTADPANEMAATAPAVAPNQVDASNNPIPARITVTADADLGAGVVTLTGVSDDIFVTLDPAAQASVMTITLGAAVPKT